MVIGEIGPMGFLFRQVLKGLERGHKKFLREIYERYFLAFESWLFPSRHCEKSEGVNLKEV